jgi:RNA polymerase sigma factor (sigma-70 family)
MLKLLQPNLPSRWTDEELLARYSAGGDLHYLGVLYERYMPMVYGVCLKVLRDSGLAEDAVMTIFEELTVKARTYEIESFRGWLYVLAKNHCLMEWRKMQRKPVDLYEPGNLPFSENGQSIHAPELELSSAQPEPLQYCLGLLPDAQRRSVELFYYEEKSYKEIAGLLDQELGIVRSHIQNGRRNLKICLEKQGVHRLTDIPPQP